MCTICAYVSLRNMRMYVYTLCVEAHTIPECKDMPHILYTDVSLHKQTGRRA
jgi:hypothetical protein